MSRPLSSEERRLWSRVARTVRLAPGHKVEALDEDAAPAASSVTAAPKTPLRKTKATPRKPSPPEDLSGQRRIRRGQNEIDARLDLHGHTQDTAHRELVTFIRREASAGSRCVLVITGKGRLGTGVLRARFNDWVADPDLRPLIAGYARAHPRHGGEGATYLFLRASR
jgi:DNA-nicking Smr family endonuclease